MMEGFAFGFQLRNYPITKFFGKTTLRAPKREQSSRYSPHQVGVNQGNLSNSRRIFTVAPPSTFSPFMPVKENPWQQDRSLLSSARGAIHFQSARYPTGPLGFSRLSALIAEKRLISAYRNRWRD
jgi:hypothetical protein